MEELGGGRGRRERGVSCCWSRRLPPATLGGTRVAGSTHVLCGSWALAEWTLPSLGLQETFTICCLYHPSTIHNYFSPKATQNEDRTKTEQGEATSPSALPQGLCCLFAPKVCTLICPLPRWSAMRPCPGPPIFSLSLPSLAKAHLHLE